LAVAERERANGRDLLTAIVAGYQVMVWSIGPINMRILDIGWHGMKVGGGFAAAATSAKLLGLDAEGIAQALAIAGSEASGITEYNQSGGDAKRYHAGMAARSGVQAALLAQAGLTGPLTVFEGQRGIHRLFSNGTPGPIEPFWNGDFHISRNMYKLYPAVGTFHAPLDALSMILTRRPAADDEIDRIEVRMADWAVRHSTTIKRPTDMTGAQYSLGFAMALRIVRGCAGLEQFSNPANWMDPALLTLADRVSVSAMSVPEGANEMYGDVTVHFRDGSSEHAFVPVPRGFYTNPASTADLHAKFREVTAHQLKPSDAEQMIALVEGADEIADVRMLWSALGQG
jgi:2-methylcitrate dehydratase PrpD